MNDRNPTGNVHGPKVDDESSILGSGPQPAGRLLGPSGNRLCLHQALGSLLAQLPAHLRVCGPGGSGAPHPRPGAPNEAVTEAVLTPGIPLAYCRLIARIATARNAMRYDLNLWIGHPLEGATYLSR
jgi:hypothetical protein